MNDLTYHLYQAADVRLMDRFAIDECHIPGATLMARAGRAAYDVMLKRWPEARRIIVLCGVGNNGGDGYVVARLAHDAGLDVTVLQWGDATRLKGDALLAANSMNAAGLEASAYQGQSLQGFDVIVDALLGTGLDRALEGDWLDAIVAVNRVCSEHSGEGETKLLSIDIPSGLHADTGCLLGGAVKADITVTFIGLKQGLYTAKGPEQCGEIIFDDLGVADQVGQVCPPTAQLMDLSTPTIKRLARRERAAHKGDNGHVLIVGGNHGMSGAAQLAGRGALRCGAGLVSIATRTEHAAMMSMAQPELMAKAVEDDQDMAILNERATVIAIGPGLGRDTWARQRLQAVLNGSKPLIVDADALNLLSEAPVHNDHWILTPHPGEAARLLGVTAAEIEQDRYTVVRAIQKQYGGVVVLKGAGTLVCASESDIGVCDEGNPGMAAGGMGDVLTGVIAALVAQGLTLRDAARLGVCLHARAGDRASQSGERGMIASDLLPHLRRWVNQVDG